MISISHNFKKNTQTELEAVMSASIYPIKYIDALECSNLEYQEQFSDDFAPIIPPFSNTGVMKKTTVKTYGCNSTTPTQFSCIVDFLSFSFGLTLLQDDDLGLSSYDAVERFIEQFFVHVPNLKWAFMDKGLFGYKHSVSLARLGQNVGLIGFGGNNNSCYVSLSGQGCVGVDMYKLKEFIEVLPSCKLTRIDLAHDDLDGLTGVEDFLDMYKAGMFAPTVGGASPSARFLDDLGTGKGKTLYVGAKKNGKEACIYEKGRQLGDKNSKWVRVEGRLTANKRVVPFDAMVNPAMYLAGCYHPFSALSAIHARLVIIKNHAKIALDVLIEHASIAYGRLIDYMLFLGWSESKIIAALRKKGVPKRLLIPETETINMIPF